MVDFVTLFLSFLFAFIVKDFYDIFIQSHIKKWLLNYKTKYDLKWLLKTAKELNLKVEDLNSKDDK